MLAVQPVSRGERVAGLTVRVGGVLLGFGEQERVVGFPPRLPPSRVRLAFAGMPRIGLPELFELDGIILVGALLRGRFGLARFPVT